LNGFALSIGRIAETVYCVTPCQLSAYRSMYRSNPSEFVNYHYRLR